MATLRKKDREKLRFSNLKKSAIGEEGIYFNCGGMAKKPIAG